VISLFVLLVPDASRLRCLLSWLLHGELRYPTVRLLRLVFVVVVVYVVARALRGLSRFYRASREMTAEALAPLKITSARVCAKMTVFRLRRRNFNSYCSINKSTVH